MRIQMIQEANAEENSKNKCKQQQNIAQQNQKKKNKK